MWSGSLDCWVGFLSAATHTYLLRKIVPWLPGRGGKRGVESPGLSSIQTGRGSLPTLSSILLRNSRTLSALFAHLRDPAKILGSGKNPTVAINRLGCFHVQVKSNLLPVRHLGLAKEWMEAVKIPPGHHNTALILRASILVNSKTKLDLSLHLIMLSNFEITGFLQSCENYSRETPCPFYWVSPNDIM